MQKEEKKKIKQKRWTKEEKIRYLTFLIARRESFHIKILSRQTFE